MKGALRNGENYKFYVYFTTITKAKKKKNRINIMEPYIIFWPTIKTNYETL